MQTTFCRPHCPLRLPRIWATGVLGVGFAVGETILHPCSIGGAATRAARNRVSARCGETHARHACPPDSGLSGLRLAPACWLRRSATATDVGPNQVAASLGLEGV